MRRESRVEGVDRVELPLGQSVGDGDSFETILDFDEESASEVAEDAVDRHPRAQ